MFAELTADPVNQPPDLSSLCLAITEHAPFPMATMEGAEHLVRYVNPAFCRLMNKTVEELIGKPFAEILPERSGCLAFLDRVYHTGEPESHTEADGAAPDPLFWSYTMWPVLGAGERLVGVMLQVTETTKFHQRLAEMSEALMVGAVRQHELTEAAGLLNTQLQTEITERKQAHERLRESVKETLELRSALDEHAIVAMTDALGKISYVNDKFCTISKYSREELLGQDHRIINSGHHPQEFIRDLWTTITQGRAWHGEIKNKARDGTYYWVDTTILPFLDEQGKSRQYIAIHADITERKQAEQELVAAKNEISRHAVALEETVTQRTAQLRETIGELEAFSYSISHDMRAPLRAMRGFADILLEKHWDQLDAEGIEHLEKIHAAAGRLDSLIQDVLIYTRVLHAEVKIEPVDLEALVRQIIATYPQLHTGDVEIRIEGVLPKVLGGEASLAQCISNLLTNAVKFVAPGTKPRVKIRAEAIVDGEGSGASQEIPGAKFQVSGKAPEPPQVTPRTFPDPSHLAPRTFPRIRLWVEDNGIGIAPKDQVRIFKMFERIHRATAYEGTGMGLAIVRKAVERMGGQLGVESEAGQGSKFWIQLEGANP